LTELTMTNLRPLTSTQYDNAREKALQRVSARIGERPTRKQFQREYAPLLTILDVLALVVFIAALAISTTHILQYVQAQAAAAYHFDGDGINMTLTDFTAVKQISAIALAESAVVLFGTMHALIAHRLSGWRRYVTFPMVIAGMSAIFVFAANVSSGGDLLFALLPPITTLGLSLRMEGIVSELLKRRTEIDDKYRAALTLWESASADQTKHPEFMQLLRVELWQQLVSKNKDFADAGTGLKRAAVMRELERETWAAGDHNNAMWSSSPVASSPQPDVPERAAQVPFGSYPPVADASGVGLTTVSANGNGGVATGRA
jgi:hypothetical protein